MTEDRRIPPTARELSPADDSGIIDLRALAARYEQSTAGERASLPELFVAPSWAPPAPAAIPVRARSRWVGGALAASATLAISMVALAAVPSLIARSMREPVPAAAPVAVAPAPAPSPVVIEEVEVPVAPPPDELSVLDEPTVAPRPETAEAPTRPRRASVPSATRRTPARETTTATGTVPAAPIDSELDRLLDAALSGTRPGATTAETLPTTPSQRDVTSALRGLERQVAMCREGDGSIAATRVVIDGATGRVRSVRVTGVDAAASACVSDLVEAATFPRFAQDTFAVTFPYRI